MDESTAQTSGGARYNVWLRTGGNASKVLGILIGYDGHSL